MKPDEMRRIVESWLSRAANDLKSAKVLYVAHDADLYEDCVYHLQQSHEKLFKALQLVSGRMTPKQVRADVRVQKMFSFSQAHPEVYRHRTVKPLIADMEKAAPRIEAYLTRLKDSELGPEIAGFLEGIRRSRKSLNKLKKEPFGLVKSSEELESAVRTANMILDVLDQAEKTEKEKVDELGNAEILRAAVSVARSLGYKVADSEAVSVDEVKAAVLQMMRIAEIVSLSAAVGTFLDPLFTAVRYPDQPHEPFDENNPYTKNFMGLHDLIARMLQMSREACQAAMSTASV